MKKFFYYWLPVYAYAGLIFYLSSRPYVPTEVAGVVLNASILHMIEYAILSILLFRAFIKSNKTTFRENAIHLAIIITILYGITDEIHQYFVPGRVFSYFDILANSVGSGVILTNNVFVKGKLYFKRQLRIRSSPE